MQFLINSNELKSDARTQLRAIWCGAFGGADMGNVEDAWTVLELAFSGKHPNFEAIDAPYHDLEHTLRACICYVDLAIKSHKTPAFSPLPLPIAELGFIAILFHDTGYLKSKGDVEGNGAKYAFNHVERSQEFAETWMLEEGFDE